MLSMHFSTEAHPQSHDSLNLQCKKCHVNVSCGIKVYEWKISDNSTVKDRKINELILCKATYILYETVQYELPTQPSVLTFISCSQISYKWHIQHMLVCVSLLSSNMFSEFILLKCITRWLLFIIRSTHHVNI